ncbi:uncharacterized protein [Drosophila kikkawai]|uniref:Uncharacterized protein isoform X2 n=1 Tax=Drosophila kikkawai TaxID=30033 RepID=A0A6P4IS82_DROKI|nr:uncharacterized protein LOC108077497 isoform X2 [Drosophila kikkawai]
MELLLGKLPLGILLLQLMLLVSPAMMQQNLFYHPRQLYYDSPRLRRFEYAVPVAPPPLHYQQQTPHFQLVNYRPSYQPLALEYQQQQVPAPAPPLPPLYTQQSVQYQQRAIAPSHAELAKYRYEGCRSSSSSPPSLFKRSGPGGLQIIRTLMWPSPGVRAMEPKRKPNIFMTFSCASMAPTRVVTVTS